MEIWWYTSCTYFAGNRKFKGREIFYYKAHNFHPTLSLYIFWWNSFIHKHFYTCYLQSNISFSACSSLHYKYMHIFILWPQGIWEFLTYTSCSLYNHVSIMTDNQEQKVNLDRKCNKIRVKNQWTDHIALKWVESLRLQVKGTVL